MVKNPPAKGILERVHQVLGQMLRTAEIDMANSVTPNDVDVFLDNAAWAVVSCKHSTQDVCMVNKVRKYHSMCKTVESVHAVVETQRRIFCKY
jgi:hypothetical protein